MLFISTYSRYTHQLYLILQLSVKWLIPVMLNVRNVSGKKFQEWSITSQRWGGLNVCFLSADLSETIFVPKNQVNWRNIYQVMTLCVK